MSRKLSHACIYGSADPITLNATSVNSPGGDVTNVNTGVSGSIMFTNALEAHCDSIWTLREAIQEET